MNDFETRLILRTDNNDIFLLFTKPILSKSLKTRTGRLNYVNSLIHPVIFFLLEIVVCKILKTGTMANGYSFSAATDRNCFLENRLAFHWCINK